MREGPSVKLAQQFVKGVVGGLLGWFWPGSARAGPSSTLVAPLAAVLPMAVFGEGFCVSPPSAGGPRLARLFQIGRRLPGLQDFGLHDGLEVGQLRVVAGFGQGGGLGVQDWLREFVQVARVLILGRKSGPMRNSASGGSGVSFTRWPPISVPFREPRSRTINSPFRSNNSVCFRLTMGWAIVSRAWRPRPITIGNLSLMVRLLAFPPTTTSSASIKALGLAKLRRSGVNLHMVIFAGLEGN